HISEITLPPSFSTYGTFLPGEQHSTHTSGIVSVAFFAAALIAVAVWIFSTDRLLTGRLQRKG
ncbi:MAG: hypothetical protein ACP5FL_02560, partial [Thermoplasmatota archaeon]